MESLCLVSFPVQALDAAAGMLHLHTRAQPVVHRDVSGGRGEEVLLMGSGSSLC